MSQIKCPHCGGEFEQPNAVLMIRDQKQLEQNLFPLFWQKYPRKVAKPAAKKAWDKISPSYALFNDMMAALDWQVKQDAWLKDGGSFIPHPATWLNGERWRDEPPRQLPALPEKQSFKEQSRSKLHSLFAAGVDRQNELPEHKE